jgi:hypothetical protein
VTSEVRDPEAHGRRTGRAVFGLLLTLYGITAGGSLTTTDSVVTFELTRQMVAHGSVALPGDILGKEAERGRDGRYYSPFGLAQAVFNIPFYVAAVTLERAGVRVGREDSLAKAFVALSSAIAAAAAIWAFYVFAWRLTRSSSAAARLALVVGVGSPLWPYSKFGFNAPLAAWFTTSAVYFAWRADREGRLRDAVFAGTFVGFALLTRHELALLLLPILLVHATTPDRSVRATRAIATLAGVTPALLLWLAYNAMRFGDPFDTGYMRDATSAFGSSVWTGLYGLLCSPAASLFVYCPLALGGVAALAWLWRQDRRTAALLGGTVILVVLFYAQLGNWIAGRSYGPRYLVPIVPLLLLPLAWRFLPGRRIGRALSALCVLSAVVQAPSVLVDYAKVSVANARENGAPTKSERIGDWNTSPLVLNSRAAMDLTPRNVRWLLGTAALPPLAGGDDRDFSQRFSYSLDFWWLYLMFMRTIGHATAIAVAVTGGCLLAAQGLYVARLVRRQE